MTLLNFTNGIAVYKSLGGKSLDKPTLKSWYYMLKKVTDEHWRQAVVKVCDNQQNLATINFVYEIKVVVKEFARKELMEAKQLPQLTEGLVDPAEVASFVKQFKQEFAKDSLNYSREPRG